MNRASFYIRQKKNEEVVYSQVNGFRFNWHDHPFGIWHKGRSQWIMVDIRSGMSVINIPNRKDLDKYLTTELANKLNAAYKKPWYKQACDSMFFELFNDKWSNYDETNR